MSDFINYTFGTNSESEKISLLSEHVIEILTNGLTDGFDNKYLDLSETYINDRMMPELCEWLIKLEGKISAIGLSGNNITSAGASALFETGRVADLSIRWIYLHDNNKIDDKCMKSLGEYIKSNKNVEEIWLNYTRISDTGIEILAPYLDGNVKLKSINLSSNTRITDKSIPYLVKMIESSLIEDLEIDETSISQINIITTLLGCNRVKKGLDKLNLSFKHLDDDLTKICDAMKKYGIDKLKDINFTSNAITSKGASELFNTLRECNSVVVCLNLSSNRLDDTCMKQLGEYIETSKHLDNLNIARNQIANEGIEILSEYLIGNTSLKVLSLFENEKISDASVPYLIEIAKKSYIAEIIVSVTSISEEKKQEIEELLKIPIDQRGIPIISNSKSAAKTVSQRTT